MRRYRICALTIAAVLIGVMGCRSETSEFNWKTFRWEQVGPRNHPRIVASTQEFPEQIPACGLPTPTLTAKRQTAFDKSQIVRLYICAEAPAELEEDSYYLASQAPVAKLADLLTILYPAQGPGGSEQVRYLLYRSDIIWERAKNFAPKLDVSPIESGTYVIGQGSWETAVGLLYGSEYPRKLDPETRKRIISHLNHVIGDASASREIRWASAILAGNLHARFDPKDFITADATFGEAAGFAPGDEFEAMVVRYHHLHLLSAMNHPIKARQQAADTLNYFQKWSSTECYERISMIAAGK